MADRGIWVSMICGWICSMKLLLRLAEAIATTYFVFRSPFRSQLTLERCFHLAS
jgi:hypothetical protein